MNEMLLIWDLHLFAQYVWMIRNVIVKLEFLIVKAQNMNFCQQFEMNRKKGMNRIPIIGYVLGLRKPTYK